MHGTKLIPRLACAVLVVASIATTARAQDDKEMAFSYGVDYTLATDYVWRGLNLSEYDGEGREDLNHQLSVYGAVDTEIGTFGGNVWFEWFAGQDELDPDADGHLQEVDYTAYYGNTVGPVYGELGWILYTFPSTGGGNTTNEGYVSLSLDDSALWGTEEPILSPWVAYYMDLDDFRHDSWIEVGVEHTFQCAMIEGLSATPSVVLGADHRYLTGTTTQLANIVYGLGVTYDFGAALDVPETYGSFAVTGFINFSQALTDDERADGSPLLDDELWGGVTLSWAR
ncbi:MAG: hypothetical protein ACOC7R_04930 [Planctomycetota bacterium]